MRKVAVTIFFYPWLANIKKILYRFMVVTRMLKISSKSVNVIVSYKWLKILKMEVFHQFGPITDRTSAYNIRKISLKSIRRPKYLNKSTPERNQRGYRLVIDKFPYLLPAKFTPAFSKSARPEGFLKHSSSQTADDKSDCLPLLKLFSL